MYICIYSLCSTFCISGTFATATSSLKLSEMEGVQEISPALGHDESGRLAAHYTMKHQPLEACW